MPTQRVVSLFQHWLYDTEKLESLLADGQTNGGDPAFWPNSVSPFYELPLGANRFVLLRGRRSDVVNLIDPLEQCVHGVVSGRSGRPVCVHI